MQKFFRKTVFFILRQFTKFKLWRIKPQIIGITGSFAKTSVRDALAHALQQKFMVRKNKEGFNTEYGICLDILNISKTGKVGAKHSFFSWLRILGHGFFDALFSKEKYQKLILELGIDKPDDMDLILKVMKPDIQIVTGITLNHVEYGFSCEQDIWDEKKKLLYAVPKNGFAILNSDDGYVASAQHDLHCNIIDFGEKSDNASLKLTVLNSDINGLQIKFSYGDKSVDSSFEILGKQHATVLGATIATLLALNVELEEAISLLKDFKLPKHRMDKMITSNNAIVLDSTYNASPKTMMAALDLLAELPAQRKIATIGSMNELGEYSDQKHLEIGEYIAKKADVLIAVGHSADLLIQGFSKSCDKKFFKFSSSDMAAEFLKTFIQEADLILVKGSHSIEMDKIVDELC